MMRSRLFSTQLQKPVELRLMKLVNNFQHTFPPVALRVAATSPQDSQGLLHVDIVEAKDKNEVEK